MIAPVTPPAVDDARAAAALAQAQAGFVPARLRGAGDALVAALAHDGALLEAALAAAPAKHGLAFLGAMGVGVLAPAPARAPLVFALAPDAPVDVPLPRGSEVAVVLPPPLPGSLGAPAADAPPPEPIVFATEQEIALARARLGAVLSVVPAEDRFADHTASLTGGFSLFDDTVPVPHELYFGDDELFDLPGAATLVVRASVDALTGSRPLSLRWEFLTEDGWLEFAVARDRTHGLAFDGDVVLEKRCEVKAIRSTVAGLETFWIRARTDRPLPLPGAVAGDALPRLETVRVSVRHGTDGLALDAAGADGIRVDTTRDFRPFGPRAALGSTFLLACDEAFRRTGALITLALTGSAGVTPTPSSELALAWEYSTGPGTWAPLEPEAGAALDDDVTFRRPDDWVSAPVEGERHLWLRVRIAAGDYGGPPVYAIDDATHEVTVSNEPVPPSFASLTVGYAFETAARPVGACVTVNRFEAADHTEECRFGRPGFAPFAPVEDRAPAVYLGFDAPLPVGLVSLFAEIPADVEAVDPPQSPFTWEYASADGWQELAVLDETEGFGRSGVVQFVGPPDLAAAPGPTGPLHWIRARTKEPSAAAAPLPVTSIRLNAVWATHRRVVAGEIAGRSDGSPRLTLALQHPPVLAGSVVEVQEWTGTGREWEGLFADVEEAALRIERTPRGDPAAVWVRWAERAHLYSSGPRDRHYTLEPTTGLLRFGDGVRGMVPPPGAAVSAGYAWGGGPQGNVPLGTITQLHSAVPYVQGVSNATPASGGSEAESSGAVAARGPHRLRSRGRALSGADYEWLAREASPEVAWARCVPATGPEGVLRPGWVTVAVAPAGGGAAPQPSAALLRRVHDALSAVCPAALARSIRVIGPDYQPVAVIAEVVVSDPGGAARTEEALRARLDAFLHPLTGGPDGRGWELGAVVGLSSVARIVEGTPGVDHATQLQLSADGAVAGDRLALAPGRLPVAGRHVVRLRLEAR